jgi:hypothetical protein
MLRACCSGLGLRPYTAPMMPVTSPVAMTQAVRTFSATAPCLMFSPTQVNLFAHWYSGRLLKHRASRDKRYNPKFSVEKQGRNRFSKRLYYKSNRWNYKVAYKDMP